MDADPIYQPYWTAVSPFTPLQDGKGSAVCNGEIKTHFSTLIGREVVGVKDELVGHGVFNVVYDLLINDMGPACVARICYNFKDTGVGRKYARDTTDEEVAILNFLAANAPNILAPKVLSHDTDPQNPIGAPFIIESKLNGCNLLKVALDEKLWAHFSFEKFIPGLARALVDLFSIPLPDSIGVFRGVSSDGIPVIGPFREEEIYRGSEHPFHSVKEYLRWRVFATKWEKMEDASVDVPALLDRLFVLSTRLTARLDPSLLRVCLVHVDPHDRNVLVHDSEFSGLVDWQALALPAILAAEYPPYLRYDGMREDRYTACNEYGDVEYMDKYLRPSEDKAKALRELYLQSCKDRNPLYAEAIVQGQALRQLIEWLNFVEWKGDFVWQGLELWEADQRKHLDGLLA